MFYSLLFDPGQFTCYGSTHKATRVSPVRAHVREPFFTINALHPTRDLQPTLAYHAPDRPRRADHNVICLRNILIELDQGSPDEQMNAMTGIPWSTCVWSGGKSLHFLISLVDPLPDRLAYARLVKDLYAALQTSGVALDPANKNPSRFSRTPGVVRPETGRMQELREVRTRVPNAELEEWVAARRPRVVVSSRLLPLEKRVFAATERFLAEGAPAGQWNTSLFRAACNLFENGHALEDVVTRARAITGVLDDSDLATIRSAHARVRAG